VYHDQYYAHEGFAMKVAWLVAMDRSVCGELVYSLAGCKGACWAKVTGDDG